MAKEKAKELVDKFNEYTVQASITYPNGKTEEFLGDAKECALIAVDEILDILNFDLGHDDTARHLSKYYEQVKQEIEKL